MANLERTRGGGTSADGAGWLGRVWPEEEEWAEEEVWAEEAEGGAAEGEEVREEVDWRRG